MPNPTTVSKNEQHASHTVHEISCPSVPISSIEYSCFKYGSVSIANRYGIELADSFWKSELQDRVREQIKAQAQVIVFPPPYINLPTAGYLLARAFASKLNQHLHIENLDKVLFGKIWRKKSYSTDYSSLKKAERQLLFTNESFDTDIGRLEHSFAIFVDDIRITGSHEERILEMLKRYGKRLGDTALINYAKVTNDQLDASIEDELNRAAMNDMSTIVKLIADNDFEWNTRITKHVLTLPKDKFLSFLNAIPLTYQKSLLQAGHFNGYGGLVEFKDNLDELLSRAIC